MDFILTTHYHLGQDTFHVLKSPMLVATILDSVVLDPLAQATAWLWV